MHVKQFEFPGRKLFNACPTFGCDDAGFISEELELLFRAD